MQAAKNCLVPPAPARPRSRLALQPVLAFSLSQGVPPIVSPLLVQLNRGHGYSITLSFFEPLIKDKPWHLKLWGGFDDLVAGYLLSGSEAGGEQESTNI